MLVKSDERPVPLEFEYRETPLDETVQELVEAGRAPIYLVHFTQRACADGAEPDEPEFLLEGGEARRSPRRWQEADFRSPYGKEVRKLLRHGLGIHHAGLLPKYRVLVEKLAQRGLLKVICGTDTLGVGVNVPIRTVLFTQLFKFDGQGTQDPDGARLQADLRAGRAARASMTVGYVVAQAPEHVIENLQGWSRRPRRRERRAAS